MRQGALHLHKTIRRLSTFRTMYYACRTDYPCEGCEQPRWMAFRNALAYAKENR